MAFTAFTLAQLQATVVLPTDTLDVALHKVALAEQYAFLWWQYKYTDTGTFTDPFCTEIATCYAASIAQPTT